MLGAQEGPEQCIQPAEGWDVNGTPQGGGGKGPAQAGCSTQWL